MKKPGFTLIELMITIAIVGILLSLAVPAYQDYTVRAKVSGALNMAAPAKTLIAEYYISEAALPPDQDAAGIESVATDYLASIGYAYNETETLGTITLRLSNNVGGEADGKTILLQATPDAANILRWSCGVGSGEEAIDAKYLPASCRSNTAGEEAEETTEGG